MSPGDCSATYRFQRLQRHLAISDRTETIKVSRVDCSYNRFKIYISGYDGKDVCYKGQCINGVCTPGGNIATTTPKGGETTTRKGEIVLGKSCNKYGLYCTVTMHVQ